MIVTRRGLVVAGIVVAVLAGFLGLAPAYASFSDSTTASTSITTMVVAAPTNVVGSLTCGSTSGTMSLTWTASTSPRVSGYLVTVYFSDGYKQTVQKAATDTSWSASIGIYNVTAYQVQYSVTTQVNNWTAESATTGWFHC